MDSSLPAHESPLRTSRPRVRSSSPDDDTFASSTSEEEGTQEEHHCGCCGRAQRYNAEKLGYIFNLLRTWRWSFIKLLDEFSSRRKEPKYLQPWSRFQDYIRDPESSAYKALSSTERRKIFNARWDWVAEELRQELTQVSDLPVFGEFSVKDRMQNIKLLENATSSIAATAPTLSRVLRLLDHPRWAKEKAEDVALQPRHFLILSIMCVF